MFAHYYSDGADDAYSCLDFVRFVRGVVDCEGIIHQGLLQWFTGVSNHSEASKNIYFLSTHFKSALCVRKIYHFAHENNNNNIMLTEIKTEKQNYHDKY